MTQKRIGFACKFLHPNQSMKKQLLEDYQRPLNTRSTTVAWLNRQPREIAEERLWDIMVHNIQSYRKLIEYVGSLDPELRMVRLGSDVLPVYTQADWGYFWHKDDVRKYCEQHFAKVGEIARSLDVRLSMHPGQFCCFGSDRDDVVLRSIEEFEYHVDVIRWMGYGIKFQDFKCNIHVSGRSGVIGVKQVLKKISPEARNVITFENDEYSTGIDQLIELADDAALVPDLHHHFVREGEYLLPTDDRVKRIIDSWRGVRPVLHYSYSRNENLPQDFKHDSFPDMNRLLEAGYKKQKLRAHSDYYPNRLVNEWALSFRENFDIMSESKFKNLASRQLWEQANDKRQNVRINQMVPEHV